MSRGTVLITGITGFIATYTALAFLDAGYTVKGTVRTASKAEAWTARFIAYRERFEYAIVPDMVAPGAFDDAVTGCDFVAHIASPAHWSPKDNEKDLLIPAIAGTRNLLAATALEPRIKRVVFTSSLSALLEPTSGLPALIDEKIWNEMTYEQAKAASNPAVVYRASKALAERVFWDYIRDSKPAWEGATICPCATFGPPLQPLSSLAELNLSNKYLWDMANGTYKAGVPALGSPLFVNARDVALAHVRAVEREAGGERYLLVGGRSVPDQIVDAIHRHFPELRENLPQVDLTKTAVTGGVEYNSSKAVRELGIEYTPLEKTVVDTVGEILKLQKTLESN